MTRSAGSLCAGRLQEANFCSFQEQREGRETLPKEKRLAARFVHEEPVVLETQDGDLIGAIVMNYSKNGLYFESNLNVGQGVIIRIRNEASLACSDGLGLQCQCVSYRGFLRLRGLIHGLDVKYRALVL